MTTLTPQATELFERTRELLVGAFEIEVTHALIARSVDTACVLCDENIALTFARDGQRQWYVVSQACSEAFAAYCRTHICDIEEV